MIRMKKIIKGESILGFVKGWDIIRLYKGYIWGTVYMGGSRDQGNQSS